MIDKQPNNPLHGITLEQVVTVASSLKFLRRTPWAREKVEAFFIAAFTDKALASHQAKAVGPWAKGLANLEAKGL